MRRIDRETTQRIIDTADIVEVVSDYVQLRRSGASYTGLCPFHNERTPSFSVSKSRNICKCFSCGKGGSPVNFIMEMEHITFQEALRVLARKYNIEIKEYEVSDAERAQESERASLLAVNEFALRHFEHNLKETDDGRNIGLTYLQRRGVSDAMIERFRLGYALEQSNALLQDATAKGYNEKYLVETGLCIRTDQGRVYDRFKGRVIFPVFSISGKVIAFGGRTLTNSPAKYVNSPESQIYHKSRELYGLYQAKQAISRQDKCILVEGYLDVISMHQSGIENVVASSGTSLTEDQIRAIRRFTKNVTVIYDGDNAGIKASLRGIDMLLGEGMNIKVLLLPDGDDPDSFAQKHSSGEVEQYIADNETDFLKFKTRILLKDAGDDPLARARVINDIVGSIARIPDMVTARVYAGECSRMLEIDERTVTLQIDKVRNELAEQHSLQRHRNNAKESIASGPGVTPDDPVAATISGATDSDNTMTAAVSAVMSVAPAKEERRDSMRHKCEMALLTYLMRYGMCTFADEIDDRGQSHSINVLHFIDDELKADAIEMTDPIALKVINEALRIDAEEYADDKRQANETALTNRSKFFAETMDEIRRTAQTMEEIEQREKRATEQADNMYYEEISRYDATYLGRKLCSHPDAEIRSIALRLVPERHVLSKIHTRFAHVETDLDRLVELVPRSINELKDAILEDELHSLRGQMNEANRHGDTNSVISIMRQVDEISRKRRILAEYLGERIVNPRVK